MLEIFYPLVLSSHAHKRQDFASQSQELGIQLGLLCGL